MDDESYHTREVCANFGLAVYYAQVLEYEVVNLLTLAKIFPDSTATREMFVPVMDYHFAQVFGRLVKKVTSYQCMLSNSGSHQDMEVDRMLAELAVMPE